MRSRVKSATLPDFGKAGGNLVPISALNGFVKALGRIMNRRI